jgi:hypothetical protein
VIELPVTIIVRGPTLETQHAKVDHDDSAAGPDRHIRGDCADGWFANRRRSHTYNPPFIETVDSWADMQDDMPSRSEAIRRLVELGLKAKK